MLKKAVVMMAFIIMLTLCAPTSTAQTPMPFIYNDEIVYLSAEETPIERDGVFFMPIEPVLRIVGGNYVYDEVTNTVTIFKGETVLAFYLDYNIVITNDSRFYEQTVFIENNLIYIPVSFVVSELGGIYSEPLEGFHRIKVRSAQITDSDFARLILSMPADLTNRVNNPAFYLCFTYGQYSENHLRILRNMGYSGIFFVTESQIRKSPAEIRQLLIEGHTVGLMLSQSFESDKGHNDAAILNEFNRINDLFQKATRTRAKLVMFRKGSVYNNDTVINLLQKNGYRTWKTNIEFVDDIYSSYSPSTILQMTVRNLPRTKWNSAIYIKNTANANSALNDLMTFLSTNKYNVRKAYDTTIPVNFKTMAE